MKRTINYLCAALTLIAVASCTKDIQPNELNEGQSELRTIELSFENSGITKVGVTDRTPQWEVGDTIWISNGTSSEVKKLASEDITDNVAKISTTLSGTLYAVYPASAQNGVIDDSGTKKIGFKIPTSTDGAFGNAHISVAEGTTSLIFKNVVSILKITTEDATKLVNISSASAIAGEFKVKYDTRNVEAGTTQAYGINITSSAAGEKYVAVASGVAFNALEFTAVKTATDWATKKSAQTSTTGINTMYNIGEVSGWSYTTTNSLLWAKFSVAADEQVRFTKGNLWCNASASPVTYSFESAQNVTYTTLGQSAYDASHVCHFFWVTPSEATVAATAPWAESFGTHTQTKDDQFWCGADNPMTVDGQSDLYALTGGDSGEWDYLFNSRTNASSLYKKGVSVTTSAGTVTNCVVIAPDNWDYTNNPLHATYTAEAWATAESAGLVCLPAAGSRSGSDLSDGGSYGNYWSATPYSLWRYAYSLNFDDIDFYPSSHSYRSYGYSVRLVCSVSK